MDDADNLVMKVSLIITIAVVMIITYLVLLSSGKIIKIIGNTGNNVLMRLMGLIIMVIAVEFIFAGLRPYIESF